MFRKNNNHTIVEERLLDERIKENTNTYWEMHYSSEDGKRLEDLCEQYLQDFEDKGLTIREVERLTDMLMHKAYHAVLRQKRKFKFTYLP